MNIICKKSDLTEGINIVLKAIPSKTTMPILECLVMDAREDYIKFTTNDMELGIETIINGNIKEGGSILVNAKVFAEIIRKLPDDEVFIQTDSNLNINIKCGKSKFSISGISSDEFPLLPQIEKSNKVIISQFMLKEMIRQTVFSISDNESNKLMTGELFEIKDDEFKIVSLDGHRISIRRIHLKENYGEIKVIVPGKTLIEISKILNGNMEDEVSIYFTDKHVLFEFNRTIVLSRLIEGNYYNIEQMLSNDYETKITVKKMELLNCIDRATLLLKETEKKPIIIKTEENTLNLTMNTKIGSMDEDVEIHKEGKDILIAFNPKFLIDALRVIDEEDINIYLFNPKAPCFIKNDEETYIYLILPVNLNH